MKLINLWYNFVEYITTEKSDNLFMFIVGFSYIYIIVQLIRWCL